MRYFFKGWVDAYYKIECTIHGPDVLIICVGVCCEYVFQKTWISIAMHLEKHEALPMAIWNIKRKSLNALLD